MKRNREVKTPEPTFEYNPYIQNYTMEGVFKKFATFGAGSKESKDVKDSVVLMDNAKFAKFARDCKLIDKKLTTTDIDIFFTKIKAKTERKITYKQFQAGLQLIADKKYPNDPEAREKLEAKILEAGGPGKSGVTKTVNAGAVDRLTDTTKYTGSHKERFDDSGKGKGLDGRRDFDKKASEGYVGGYKDMGTYEDKTKEEDN